VVENGNKTPFRVDFYLQLPNTELITTGRLVLQQQSVSRRTSAVPMAFSVYVRVHDVTVCWTAPTTQTNSTAVSTKLTLISCFTLLFIICPIAIAYSMGQMIKSVCVCQCVSLSVCQCICPSARTLTVAFLDRFSPKLAWHRRKNPQK